MSQSSSLASSLGSLASIFSRSGHGAGGSGETLHLKQRNAQLLHCVSYVERLPTELLLRIFMEVIENDNCDFAWIGILSSVSLRWYRVCQHTVLWEFVAKRTFVAYPLVQRLRCAPIDDSDVELLSRMRLGAPEQFITQHDAMKPLIAPTSRTLREAVDSVKLYQERRSYYEYVQRRRVFVLHMLLSWALLSFSLFLTSTVCAAEGIVFGDVCTAGTAFSMLWITYLAIITIVIANVVMTTHFEPKPLMYRLRKNKPLIVRSSVAIVVGIVNVLLPTLLLQLNFNRENRFSWIWCGTTPIVSLCLWQSYVLLSCIAPDAKQQLHEQRSRIRPKVFFTFLVVNVPNAFPVLFAGAIFCVLRYADCGSRAYVLIGTIPVTTSLTVLTLLFLLDFCLTKRARDLITGTCLLLAELFPLSLLWTNFRGACLLPVAVASVIFFCAHMRLVASRALKELLEGANSCGRSY